MTILQNRSSVCTTYGCYCVTVPVIEVKEETAAQMGLTGRPGSNPESGGENLPSTQPSSSQHTHTRTHESDTWIRDTGQTIAQVTAKQRQKNLIVRENPQPLALTFSLACASGA